MYITQDKNECGKNKMLINITYRLLWRIIKGMRIIARCFVLKRAVALKNEPLCKP